VPGPRPSDAELLGSLGMDLDTIRRATEQAFGGTALEWAIREATRARRGGVGAGATDAPARPADADRSGVVSRWPAGQGARY
jgi:hypothetical protein